MVQQVGYKSTDILKPRFKDQKILHGKLLKCNLNYENNLVSLKVEFCV